MKKTVGIIGFGNMGSAIAVRIKKKYSVIVFDKDCDKTKSLSGIEIAESPINLINKVDVVILAIKPQDFETLLNEIKGYIKEQLIISIAAGIATSYIEKHLGQVRVIRAMPNIPARIGKGISCLSKGRYTEAKDLNFALKLFRFLGITFVLDEDMMMDVATAVSGSGPGFWCNAVENMPHDKWKEYNENEFIPFYSTIAEAEGFNKKDARLIAEMVGRGSLATVESCHITPSQLKEQVASKGGTTAAGLEVLRKNGSWQDAVEAAIRRAKELSKK